MPVVTTSIDLNLEDLAHEIATENSHEVTMDFILLLDKYASDYGFTEILVNKLQDALKAEDEAANGTL